MHQQTKNWRQLAREAINQKDPGKLIALANELQEALEREQRKPAQRTGAKLLFEEGSTSESQHSGD